MGLIYLNMTSGREERRLEAYVDEYTEESSDGMGLSAINEDGGGSNVPDDTRSYESRREWLEDTNGGFSVGVWRHLAEQEYKGRQPQEREELVFIEIPGWFASDDEDLSPVFGNVHNGSEINTFAILKSEKSKGKDAYMFSRFYTDKRGWTAIPNQYKTATVPCSVCTMYKREGKPREVDKARIRQREALPESVDPFEAEENDYDWRLALGAAYRRNIDEEENRLEKAYESANELPSQLNDRVEIGVNEYMRQVESEGKEVDSDELAIVVESLVKALEPGARGKKNK